ESIRVVVRCRPFSQKEKEAGYAKIADIYPDKGVVVLTRPKEGQEDKTFTFDAAFAMDSEQVRDLRAVYDQTASAIVDAVLAGFNGTVFVYGQTGTGKTFTMEGVRSVPHLRGIIPNAFEHIFSHIARATSKQFLVRVSYMEIYNEEIRDLLGKDPGRPCELRGNPESGGVCVKDLSSFVVKSVGEMDGLMTAGNRNRSVAATEMNANSSRSHSIFTITVECCEKGADGRDHFYAGKLHLVDLAGSERQSKTGASGERLKEATKINLSLSALGNCISSLVDGKSTHIPYRDSKLTRLLQDSLGGNSKTLMIATMSPAAYNYDETLSSLRYANRAKNIKNKPKINEDPKDAMLREYQEEIKRLREKLLARGKGGEGAPRPPREKKKKIIKVIKVKKRPRRPSTAGEAVSPEAAAGEAEAAGRPPRAQAEAAEEEEAVGEEAVGEEAGEDEEGTEEEEVEEEVEVEDDEQPAALQFATLDPETIARLQDEVEEERRALLAAKDMVASDKQRIASELETRAAELERERQERLALEAQLTAMEAKLLVGGVNIVEHVSSRQTALDEETLKVEEKRRAQRELQQQVEAKQENQLQMEESYASLQEEVDVKTKKLKKLWAKLQAAKSEIGDLQDEFRGEREDLLDTIRELSRELNVKSAVIENFVPAAERMKVERRAAYDPEKDDWQLSPLTELNLANKLRRPLAAPGRTRRPLSHWAQAKIASGDPNPRYRPENILTIALDMPERTTRSYLALIAQPSVPGSAAAAAGGTPRRHRPPAAYRESLDLAVRAETPDRSAGRAAVYRSGGGSAPPDRSGGGGGGGGGLGARETPSARRPTTSSRHRNAGAPPSPPKAPKGRPSWDCDYDDGDSDGGGGGGGGGGDGGVGVGFGSARPRSRNPVLSKMRFA
ncbi:MAG: P-loop containing nucleoside triphosphate hydrolase protein, partial [Olpidium bornovanus]